jgi:hypothetical protein
VGSSPNEDGFRFVHDPFSVTAKYPTTASVCGALSYEASFKGEPINMTTSPVKYDIASRTFIVYTEDENLIDEHEITL